MACVTHTPIEAREAAERGERKWFVGKWLTRG